MELETTCARRFFVLGVRGGGEGGGKGGGREGRANLFLPPTVGGPVVGGAVVAFVALLASLDGAKNVA